MTIAVECIEAVPTVARGRPTAPRLANFSAKAGLVLSGTKGESSSIRSWKDTTGVLAPASSSIVDMGGNWAGRAIYGSSRWLAKTSPWQSRALKTPWHHRISMVALTQDNADQYLEEDLEGQVTHKIDHCCEILFYRFVAPLSYTEWPLLQRYSECSTDIAVK